MTFKQMEAHDHSFSDTARNWGYANFLSPSHLPLGVQLREHDSRFVSPERSDAYFNNPSVRLAVRSSRCSTPPPLLPS